MWKQVMQIVESSGIVLYMVCSPYHNILPNFKFNSLITLLHIFHSFLTSVGITCDEYIMGPIIEPCATLGFCWMRSQSWSNVAIRLHHILRVSDFFFLFVCSPQFSFWPIHSLAIFSSSTGKISWIVGWLSLNLVYTCISIHMSVIDL